MRLEARITRLERDYSDRLRVSATLFCFTDGAGQQWERVVVMPTGAVMGLDAYRLAYPDGELCEFQYAGVDPDRL